MDFVCGSGTSSVGHHPNGTKPDMAKDSGTAVRSGRSGSGCPAWAAQHRGKVTDLAIEGNISSGRAPCGEGGTSLAIPSFEYRNMIQSIPPSH